MAYCEKCGSEVSGNFCSNCGQALENNASAENETNAQIIETTQSEDNEAPSPRAIKAGAIFRLVLVALGSLAYFWSTIDVAGKKDWGVGRTAAELTGVFIIIVLVWLTAKLCCVMAPFAKEMWENLISLSLLGFFVKLMLFIFILFLPVSIFGVVVAPHLKEWLDHGLFSMIVAIGVSALISAALIFFDIRKLKR